MKRLYYSQVPINAVIVHVDFQVSDNATTRDLAAHFYFPQYRASVSVQGQEALVSKRRRRIA